MSSQFELLFLGTGTSAGVPMIGCDCTVCKSGDERNKRLRSSVLVSAGEYRLLVDISPDFREQALRHNIRRVDGVMITHAHVDHLFGLDDIRRLNTLMGDVEIPLYASNDGLADVYRIFDYIFREAQPGTYRPKLRTAPLEGKLCLYDGRLCVFPFDVMHGRSRTQGFRFDFEGRSLAYIPDCHQLDSTARGIIRSADVLILDTLRYRPHATHLTLDESLEIIADTNPRRAYLTHICHDLEHEKLSEELIARGFTNVAPAFDGLRINI